MLLLQLPHLLLVTVSHKNEPCRVHGFQLACKKLEFCSRLNCLHTFSLQSMFDKLVFKLPFEMLYPLLCCLQLYLKVALQLANLVTAVCDVLEHADPTVVCVGQLPAEPCLHKQSQ